jgi:hypothetical protein
MAIFTPAQIAGTQTITPKPFNFAPRLSAQSFLAARQIPVPPVGPMAAFQPIGVGRSLRVEIQHVYSGQLNDFFGPSSLICTSAVKTLIQTSAQARAVNLLAQRVPSRTDLAFTAVDMGTPLVYYSKALAVPRVSFTFEVTVNDIDTSVFATVSSLLGSAGSIPIFATAGSYLMAASTVVKVAGNLADVIFNRKKILSVTDTIEFGLPPASDSVPHQSLFVDDSAQGQFIDDIRNNYALNASGQLVATNDGSPYKGDIPYLTVAYDGTPTAQLESFESLALSADLMSRFFTDAATQGQAVSTQLLTAMKLYNDFEYRAQAQQIKANAAPGPLSADQQKIYDAIVANIQDPGFKGGL